MSTKEVGATLQALIARASEQGKADGYMAYGVAGLVDYLGFAPREYTPVVTADAVRYLSTTRPTLIKAWETAEALGLITRESRVYAGARRTGYIRFSDQLLADIDSILSEEETAEES